MFALLSIGTTIHTGKLLIKGFGITIQNTTRYCAAFSATYSFIESHSSVCQLLTDSSLICMTRKLLFRQRSFCHLQVASTSFNSYRMTGIYWDIASTNLLQHRVRMEFPDNPYPQVKYNNTTIKDNNLMLR